MKKFILALVAKLQTGKRTFLWTVISKSRSHTAGRCSPTSWYSKNGVLPMGTAEIAQKKPVILYDYTLPLETRCPLFWVHYSYLGLNPHFSDDYADYWEQNVNASLINHAYCVANPKHFVGYSDTCWGLTASDNQDNYNAHSPTNELA
jgi:hypothetical protein